MVPRTRLAAGSLLLALASCASRGDRAPASGDPPSVEYVEPAPTADVVKSTPAASTPEIPAPTPAAPAFSNSAPGTDRSDVFAGKVAPMLARNCTPCHVPGGKLYASLPFDKSDVVAAHATAMLKRLKSPEDKRLLEDWAASQAKAP